MGAHTLKASIVKGGPPLKKVSNFNIQAVLLLTRFANNMGFEIIRFILVLSFVHITIWTKKSEITLLTVWVSNLGPTFEYITQVMYGSRFPSTGPGSRVRIWVGPISVTHTVLLRLHSFLLQSLKLLFFQSLKKECKQRTLVPMVTLFAY